MTRLFFRFYVGIVAILVVAWIVQAYIADLPTTQNVSVVEDALAGGVRLARDHVANIWDEETSVSASKYKQVASKFTYPMIPIAFSNADWLDEPYRQRLLEGEVVLLGDRIAIAIFPTLQPEKSIADELLFSGSSTSATPIEPAMQTNAEDRMLESSDPDYFLLFGPLPQFVGPSRSKVTLGYGIIFLLAAIAIAILLRPVAKQFRAVELTATSIASGNLQARIATNSRSQDLALVIAFNGMADRTEALLRSQRELLQAVSHELRTPLARIRFATDLVETATNNEERRKRLDSIDNATEKLDLLVEELLTYARIESNASEMTPEPVDVWNKIEEAVDFHAPLYPKINYVLPPNPKRLITQAHSDSLARAIDNLVSNAGQHAKSRILLSANIVDKFVVITVEDDGHGIPETEWKNVFEPFRRLNSGDNRGVGLGLALVERITKQHKGQATIGKSNLGGACLTIRLPHISNSIEN